MIPSKVCLGILSAVIFQTLAAQPRLVLKSGFEQQLHDAVNAGRVIDTHEHLMSVKEALASSRNLTSLIRATMA